MLYYSHIKEVQSNGKVKQPTLTKPDDQKHKGI